MGWAIEAPLYLVAGFADVIQIKGSGKTSLQYDGSGIWIYEKKMCNRRNEIKMHWIKKSDATGILFAY